MRLLPAALAALAFALAATAAAAPARTELTIRVQSALGPTVRHTHPPAGDVGDEFVSSLLLLSPKTHRQLGSMSYRFTILRQCHGFTAKCSATARIASTTRFRDGTIRAAGKRVAISGRTIRLPVTGGTGRYAGASGTLEFGPASTQRNVYRLKLP